MNALQSVTTEFQLAESVLPGAREFTLTPPLSPAFQSTRILVSLLHIAFWVYLTGMALALALDGNAPASAWILVIGVWLMGSAFIAWSLQPLLSSIRLETVTLSSDEFRYDPGNLGAVLFRFGFLMFFFVEFSYRGAWASHAIVIPKSQLKIKMLDDIWRIGRWRLVLLWHDREVELGTCLTDVQRVQLHQMIMEWQRECDTPA